MSLINDAVLPDAAEADTLEVSADGLIGTPDAEGAGAPDLGDPGVTTRQQYSASIRLFGAEAVPERLVDLVQGIESAFGQPVWLLIQRNHHDHPAWAHLEEPVRLGFFRARRELRACKRVTLVIDSPGGLAESAYQIATMLRRHCGGFDAVVPRYAKSAATLLALGAERIFLGSDAELGPLDAQLRDSEREEWTSALDEVQALERLSAVALDQLNQAMLMLLLKTDKKMETLLPFALRFGTELTRPLLEKMDTIHFTQQSRLLKVAEDYATRLLAPYYERSEAEAIARHLVNNYPEHGFVIDYEDASTFLRLPDMSDAQRAVLDATEECLTFMPPLTVIGRLVERED